MEENNEGFEASKVHAIGFSLGAHVASFASKVMIGFIDSWYLFDVFFAQATRLKSHQGSNLIG